MKKRGGMRKAGATRRRFPLRRSVPLKYNAKRVGGPNTCRIQQTLSTLPILANTPYRISIGGITGARALAVAEQFGLYRIAKVVFKYKPAQDTFVSNPGFVGGAGAVSVPHLYWKMNRFADNPAAWAVDDIKAMGAKPFRFDDKTVTIAYKPNILEAVASGGDNSGHIKMTPWLNTDSAAETPGFLPSDTEHYGHFYYIECATNGDGSTPVGTVEATIYYEFKTPRVEWTPESAGGIRVVNPYASRATTVVEPSV